MTAVTNRCAVAKRTSDEGESGKRSSPRAKGRRGGPGTFAGTGFQVLAAEYEVIQLIGRLLWQPQQSPHLALEPRAAASGELVGYDFGLPESRVRCEVKVNPTRSDVVEFTRTVAATDLADLGTARFAAGKGGKAVLDLTVVGRVAHEAADASRFAVLTTDLDDDQRALVDSLGEEAWERARRIEVVVTTEQDLDARIRDFASSLAGPKGGQQLREHVQSVLHQAAKNRATLNIAGIVAELGSRGIDLLAPAITDAAGLDDCVMHSLLVLQHCDSPLPFSILAEIVGVDPQVLATKLDGLVVETGLMADPPTVAVVGYPSPLHRPGEDALLERALEVLTSVVADRNRRPLGLSLLRTLRRLATIVNAGGRRPDLVAQVFPAADKVFKTAGDLHLALEVATLSVQASYRVPPGCEKPTNQMLRDRAQTLICGLSWVHQRCGHLGLADLEAQKSLTLGETLGWDRNTAFCQKCLGRLRRVQAEASGEESEQERLLHESVEYLTSAIDRFSSIDELGPSSDEVGDCKSLLARTFIATGDKHRARSMIDEALEILEDAHGTKDWADATIVDAELLGMNGETSGALTRLNDVIDGFPATDDSDATEIAARAYAARARYSRRAHPTSAIADLERAAALYGHLGDPERAAAQIVESWAIGNFLPSELAEVIRGELPLVQVQARRRYDEALSSSSRRARGQRAGARPQWLKAVVEDARADAAAIQPQW